MKYILTILIFVNVAYGQNTLSTSQLNSRYGGQFQYQLAVNVIHFGCKANDSAFDNSNYIMAALDYANKRQILDVFIPSGMNLWIKKPVFINYSNIHFWIDGKITSTSYLGAVIAGKNVPYYGNIKDRLENVWISGGTIDMTFAKLPTDASVYIQPVNGRWGGGETVQLNSVTNGKVEGITILNSLQGCIGVPNPVNVTISRNTLTGLRNTKNGQGSMANGNMINIHALDADYIGQDSSYLGGVWVENNVLDGLTPGHAYPFVMDGVTPTYGANIGINVATQPWSQSRTPINGVIIRDNFIRHCRWGANIEGQFDGGSKDGCQFTGNVVTDCEIGIAHITNSRELDNASFFMFTSNVIRNTLGDAVQIYGNTAVINGLLIENVGIGKKNHAMTTTMPLNTNVASFIKIFPTNQQNRKTFENGHIQISNVVGRNYYINDTSYHSSVRGIDLYLNDTGQVATSITISNVDLHAGYATFSGPRHEFASGVCLRGKMDNVKILNSNFTGFAGPGLFTGSPDQTGDNSSYPNGLNVFNCTFTDNQLSPNYGGGAPIHLTGNSKGLVFERTKIIQKMRPLGNAFFWQPNNWNFSTPANVEAIEFIGNTYEGIAEPYNLVVNGTVFINDRFGFNYQSAVPKAQVKYFAGTIIKNKNYPQGPSGWMCTKSGIGAAAVWEEIK